MRYGYLIPLAAGVALLGVAECERRRSAKRRRDDDGWVRSAGLREMHDAPQDWDMADERADESFPASDPPATY